MATWTYEIFFQQKQTPASDLFQQVITLAAGLGFPLEYPIDVLSLGGLGVTELADEAAFIEAVGTAGGHFMWAEDIHVTYDAAHWRLSFAALHDGESRDEEQAQTLKTVFSALCRDLEPRYGYAYDEEHLENVFAHFDFLTIWQSFIRSVSTGETPQLLFWLNYFEANYYTSIGGERCLAEVKPRLTRATNGRFAALADYPWEAKVAVLGENGVYRLLGG